MKKRAEAERRKDKCRTQEKGERRPRVCSMSCVVVPVRAGRGRVGVVGAAEQRWWVVVVLVRWC